MLHPVVTRSDRNEINTVSSGPCNGTLMGAIMISKAKTGRAMLCSPSSTSPDFSGSLVSSTS